MDGRDELDKNEITDAFSESEKSEKLSFCVEE